METLPTLDLSNFLKPKKKKILLLSDDIRHFSGIATMARELVLGTLYKYDWVQMAGSVGKHPEFGKIIDLSEALKKEHGVDGSVKIYPTENYGNRDHLNFVIMRESPDIILHFTDPRFWGWLYEIERDLRQMLPISYWNIWDAIPYPMWNKPFYQACDLLMAISKQTENINKQVLGKSNYTTLEEVIDKKSLEGKSIVHWVPHGINSELFYPITSEEDKKKLNELKEKIFKGKQYKMVFFYNNRNIGRKRTSNIILAFRTFCDNLPKEEAKKCGLLMHTDPIDPNGTDLIAVHEALCPEYDMAFTNQKLHPKEMNLLYNMVDVTINHSSNEGFGLSTCESIMAGTPIIVTCTGGLQDQIGQTSDTGEELKFNTQFGSNCRGKYKNSGIWAYVTYPTNNYIQGSPQTPYLFDDMPSWEDLSEGMMYWYKANPEKRKSAGLTGRNWVMNEGNLNSKYMCNEFMKCIDTTLEYWKPKERFSIHTSKEFNGVTGNLLPENSIGCDIPKIDMEKVNEQLKSKNLL